MCAKPESRLVIRGDSTTFSFPLQEICDAIWDVTCVHNLPIHALSIETIIEDSLEHVSTTNSTSMASEGIKKSRNMGTTINYNTTLEYHMENSLGAKVYVDPLGRYVVRVENHKIEF